MSRIVFTSVLTVVVLVVILFIGVVVYENTSKTIDPILQRLNTVCIEHHEYYFAKYDGTRILSIKLDDGGFPILCELGEKKQ